jgi:hypothetical protein
MFCQVGVSVTNYEILNWILQDLAGIISPIKRKQKVLHIPFLFSALNEYSCICMVRDCFPFLPYHSATKSIPFVRIGTQWVMSFKRTEGMSLGSAVIRGLCVTGIDDT